MKRAIFLDRDGVINSMVYNSEFGLVDSPANPSEFRLLPGVADAVKHINDMGYLAIVISNQPGIAKGKYSRSLLEAITDKMHQSLNIQGARLDDIYYCLHHPDAVLDEFRSNCNCRKPKPGLLKQAVCDWDIDLSRSYLIGDGITDIIAGKRVGVTSFFVGNRKEYLLEEFDRWGVIPDYFVKSLFEAVQIVRKIEIENKGSETFSFKKSLVVNNF
jgi:D,D-heptose 1,7-bisphosphate phosphatase